MVPVGALRSPDTEWVYVSFSWPRSSPWTLFIQEYIAYGLECYPTMVRQNNAFESLQDPEGWMNQPVEWRQIHTWHVIQLYKVKKDLLSKSILK